MARQSGIPFVTFITRNFNKLRLKLLRMVSRGVILQDLDGLQFWSCVNKLGHQSQEMLSHPEYMCWRGKCKTYITYYSIQCQCAQDSLSWEVIEHMGERVFYLTTYQINQAPYVGCWLFFTPAPIITTWRECTYTCHGSGFKCQVLELNCKTIVFRSDQVTLPVWNIPLIAVPQLQFLVLG